MSLAAGTKLDPYEIVSVVGAGGMGEVHRARDPRLGRDVAIKVLPVAYSADPDRLRRFEQVARAAAALNHPNILAVYDVGTYDALRTSCPSCSKVRRCAIAFQALELGVRMRPARRYLPAQSSTPPVCLFAKRSITPPRSLMASPPRMTKASSIEI